MCTQLRKLSELCNEVDNPSKLLPGENDYRYLCPSEDDYRHLCKTLGLLIYEYIDLPETYENRLVNIPSDFIDYKEDVKKILSNIRGDNLKVKRELRQQEMLFDFEIRFESLTTWKQFLGLSVDMIYHVPAYRPNGYRNLAYMKRKKLEEILEENKINPLPRVAEKNDTIPFFIKDREGFLNNEDFHKYGSCFKYVVEDKTHLITTFRVLSSIQERNKRQNIPNAKDLLYYVSKELREDRDVVMEAVKFNGLSLKHAPQGRLE